VHVNDSNKRKIVCKILVKHRSHNMNDADDHSRADAVAKAKGLPQHYRCNFVLVLLTILGAGSLGSLGLAQSQAVLMVEVRDESGAVIPEAKVSIAKPLENQNVSTVAHTDSRGSVSLYLPPGAYELSVSMNGFKATAKQVMLTNTDRQTIAIVLRVGGCPIPDPCPIVPEKEYPKANTAEEAFAVPDEATAVKLAEKTLAKVYGRTKIQSETPFTATLSDGVWRVTGTLYCRDKHGKVTPDTCLGGVAMAEIRQSDGRVLKTGHTK
jgi:hypothetical protein